MPPIPILSFVNIKLNEATQHAVWELGLCCTEQPGKTGSVTLQISPFPSLLTSADYSKIKVFYYLLFSAKKAARTRAQLLFIFASLRPLRTWSLLLPEENVSRTPLSVSLELQLVYFRWFLPFIGFLATPVVFSYVTWDQGDYIPLSTAGESLLYFQQDKVLPFQIERG